jgi:hypothetical protein
MPPHIVSVGPVEEFRSQFGRAHQIEVLDFRRRKRGKNVGGVQHDGWKIVRRSRIN